jgi:molybdopterin converting factor small subunit
MPFYMQMTLRILFFGPVRAQVGVDHLDVETVGEISSDDLWAGVLARFPELKPLRPTIRLGRDGEFLAPDAKLNPGDEIALIPPVSGG